MPRRDSVSSPRAFEATAGFVTKDREVSVYAARLLGQPFATRRD